MTRSLRMCVLSVVVVAAGCADEGPVAPRGPDPSVAPAPRFTVVARPGQIDLTRLAVEDVRLRVVVGVEDEDVRTLLERETYELERALADRDGVGARSRLERLVATLVHLDAADPALAAELDVVRLAVAAGNDVVVPIHDATPDRHSLDLWPRPSRMEAAPRRHP